MQCCEKCAFQCLFIKIVAMTELRIIPCNAVKNVHRQDCVGEVGHLWERGVYTYIIYMYIFFLLYICMSL